jgi:hypothetical protein
VGRGGLELSRVLELQGLGELDEPDGDGVLSLSLLFFFNFLYVKVVAANIKNKMFINIKKKLT